VSKTALSKSEFIALMALISSLSAMGIDTLLPAMSELAVIFSGDNPNGSTPINTGLAITIFILGMGFGEPLFGPLSDDIGRIKTIKLGALIFCCGSVLALIGHTFTMLLFARFIQGFGVAATKMASRALVRDLYEGTAMAKIVSQMMMVFILVPFIAPFVGQALLMLWGWQSIFIFFLMMCIGCMLWLHRRQGETLIADNRTAFSIKNLCLNAKAVLSLRSVMYYTWVAGLSFAVILVYLSNIEPFLSVRFNITISFPIYFGINAIGLGVAFFINSRLVVRFGMACLIQWALWIMVCVAGVYFLLTSIVGAIGLFGFVVLSFIGLFAVGIIFGNINALAMQHLGRVAGMGASIVASFSSFLAFAVSAGANQLPFCADKTLFLTFLVCAVLGFVALRLGLAHERIEIAQR